MTWRRRLVYAIIAPIGITILRLLWWTYRFEVDVDDEVLDLDGESEPVVVAFWHDSIFLCSWFLQTLSKQGLRITFLVSPSADGELAVRLLRLMDWQAVRGSGTRSGTKAIHGLQRAVRHRLSPVVVPDGPQGPVREAKVGAVLVARLAGIKVVPIGGTAENAWSLKTWDRLQIPKPFSRVRLNIGKPIAVTGENTFEANEVARLNLEQELTSLGPRD